MVPVVFTLPASRVSRITSLGSKLPRSRFYEAFRVRAGRVGASWIKGSGSRLAGSGFPESRLSWLARSRLAGQGFLDKNVQDRGFQRCAWQDRDWPSRGFQSRGWQKLDFLVRGFQGRSMLPFYSYALPDRRFPDAGLAALPHCRTNFHRLISL